MILIQQQTCALYAGTGYDHSAFQYNLTLSNFNSNNNLNNNSNNNSNNN